MLFSLISFANVDVLHAQKAAGKDASSKANPQPAFSLTPQERAWLLKHQTVRVCATDHAPLLFYKNDKPIGISADFLNEVSRHTGIKFDIAKPFRDFSSSMKGLIDHKGPDVIAGLNPTPEREKVIIFTKTYWSSPKFIFIRDDAPFVSSMENLSGKSVAVIRGYLTQKLIAKNYPHIKLLISKNNKDALRAVSSKKAFAFIGSLQATSAMINEFGLTNLKASAPSALPDAVVAMGIRSDWPELRGIIDNVFDAMPASDKAAIINKWSTVTFDYGIRPVDIVKWVLIIAGGALVIVLFFVFTNRRLAKKVHERTIDLETSKEVLGDEIIERRKAEERLQEYQQRLKALTFQLTIAEEKERRRIAGDLHDLIGHSLVLARIQLAAVPDSSSRTKTAVLINDISKILLKAIQDTKSLMFELSSPSLNEIGLGAAISEWLEASLDRRYRLKTEFVDEIDDSLRKKLDDSTRAILFRNVRELLINVIKHAKAKKVSVHLKGEDGIVTIVFEDDGVGFDPQTEIHPEEEGGGFGLFSIKERMADLGGSFDIQCGPGKGCRAVLSVPVGKGKG